MKCIILAGGRGDRMWPLSRKNYPKQFIEIKNNHSIFQATVARNMAFCDEFIIVTNQLYKSVIKSQMKSFRGLTYRCIFEEEGRNTAAAVLLACMPLPQSELVFVVASDQIVDGDGYKDAIVEAKGYALDGKLVSLGDDNMYLFRNGDLFSEARLLAADIYTACENAYTNKKTIGNYTYYSKAAMENIPGESFENALMSRTDRRVEVKKGFLVEEVDGLDSLSMESIRDAMDTSANNSNQYPDQIIDNKCINTTVINRADKKLVLVNQLEDVLVVNTNDAIYIGKKGKSNDLKEIILKRSDMWDYFNKSSLFYREWGYYEILQEDLHNGYQVRKVTIMPGQTIYLHKHSSKVENISVISGKGRVIVDGREELIASGECICINKLCEHQISCVSDEAFVFIESSTGVQIKSEDIISVESVDIGTSELGYENEPFVKLSPAYKDYLWGGNKLSEYFGKNTDLDCIAESWELSAHPDGQSTVAGGKNDGMLFGQYLRIIGNEAIGWKHQGMRSFPIMIKLIDANKDLSIQVHPGDEYALEHENEYGKSELWYVIDCEEGAYLYCGFNRDVDRDTVRKAIENGNIVELLNRVEVHKGDTFFIPAGTIHAIGKGALICEVQQNSNSTYRLYDYNRVDKYGNKRKLDIEKGLDVLDYCKYAGNSECKYFEVNLGKCQGENLIHMTDESFKAFMIINGGGTISCGDYSMPLIKGDCVFAPKGNGCLQLSGNMEYIQVGI